MFPNKIEGIITGTADSGLMSPVAMSIAVISSS